MSENQEALVHDDVETEIIKCDGCGANMKFDPDTRTLYCEHCGSHREIAGAGNAQELDIRQVLYSGEGQAVGNKSTVIFSCDNCGAKVEFTDGETAKCCPFCGTAHVTATEELEGIRPNAVLPFAFGKEKAVDFGKKWAKKRLFAPRKFKKTLQAESINGVYTPCFTFDSSTTSSYFGRIGIKKTRTVGSGKNRRVQTYTVWRQISGTYSFFFNDILITAGEKFDQSKLNKTGPYATEESVAYDEEYLLGFMSYKNDESIQACWDKAQNVMNNALRSKILSQYRYDVVDYLNVSTTHANVTYKYVMVPVYVGNFNYKNKLYNYYVNGRTGKVTGKTPVSALRVLLAVLLGLVAVAGVIALVLLLE